MEEFNKKLDDLRQAAKALSCDAVIEDRVGILQIPPLPDQQFYRHEATGERQITIKLKPKCMPWRNDISQPVVIHELVK